MSFRRTSRPDDWPTVHDRARSALSDQMDGALSEPEAAWLDGHLAGCPDCRLAADEYAAQRFELRALRDQQPLPPRDLWARTAAAIELESSGRSTAGRGFSRRLLLAPSAFIATALVVAVASGLLTSSQRPVSDGNDGSSPIVANASGPGRSTPGDVALGPTPIPVPRKNVDILARDDQGNYTFRVNVVDKVCPEGSTDPCDTTAPVEERSVTVSQDAQAVYGDEGQKRLIVVSPPSTKESGSVSVVSLADEPVTPSSSPNSPSSPPPSDSPAPASGSPAPTPTPSTASSAAPPSAPASPPASPLVSATPTGSIDVTPPGTGTTVEIAHGVTLVGQTASYSASGEWFAFSARPIDASAGPDIYVWRVGTPEARKVTDDGRSMFGSWAGEQLVGSTVVAPADHSDATATTGLDASSFVLDPGSGRRTQLPQAGSAWRPAVNPHGGLRAVYWTGTLRAVEGPGFAPETGRLVLGDWSQADPGASGSPAATPLSGDQSKARHETTIGAGRIDDWAAAWDPTGTHLAVWIADHQDPSVGRLSLYAVTGFEGAIDLKSPVLETRLALAGFSISDGELIWAERATGVSGKDTVQLLAWTADGVGTVETFEGSALVIR